MTSSPRFTDARGKPLELALYMFPSCPYCQRVLRRAKELGLALPQRNIRQDHQALQELQRVGGKTTVPCLFINGQPMYESLDIVRYLENDVSPA
ncbi:MAG TPA: glutaredoxin [Myxococcota bacterium]|nr:glutaredoxin [Myxococcota bacterium]